MSSSQEIGIVGAGALARALGPALASAGRRVVYWSRRPEAARELGPVVAELAELASLDVVLLAVSESAIEEVASALAAGAEGESAVALHLAGGLGLEPLAPLRRAGWSVGRLHPLLPFPPDVEAGAVAEGGWYSTLGDERALVAAREIVAQLGGHELSLESGDRAEARYHGAAVLAAGGVVALLDLALEAMGDVANPDDARSALIALARASLEALEGGDAVSALTGPVARGEEEVVSRHLEALPPGPASVYHLLAVRMLQLARARGLEEARVEAILRRLR